ncbi:MAG: fibronectin type III domain-containing protein [Prevotellaceae bacterium]|jgi:hypothetical protein|nr:fibronectin type III domain-containing protein [Prevotellaceae bacterium]
MKTPKFLLKCTLFAATAITGLQPISAKVLYVGTEGQWAGKAEGDIHATPHAAFAAAAEGDTIWIAEGTYDVAERFAMTASGVGMLASFYGGFAGTENSIAERAKVENGKGWEFTHPTVLKQTASLVGGMFYVWSIAATAATNFSLDGLVLEGYDSDNSGLFWNGSENLNSLAISIRNCWIKNFGKSGDYGDGLHLIGAAAYSSFVVDSCLIENNKGHYGGGIHVEGSKTIKNSTIRNNTAERGGGIYTYQGTAAGGIGLTITGCLIDGNTASLYGGGMFIRDLSTKYNIHNCIVVNNSTPSGGSGGGIYFGSVPTANPIATISNLTIANNRSPGGGGIRFGEDGGRVYNSIFYNNWQGSTATVENVNTAWGQPAAFSNNIIDKAYGITSTPGCIFTSDGEAIFGQNWVTSPFSPGTDKGTTEVGANFTLPNIDYAGNSRTRGDAIDIGPYEYEVIVDNDPPSAPANLTLKSASKTTLTLEWDKSTDDGSLKAYLISVNGGAPQTIALTSLDASYAEIPKICYLLTDLSANTSYTISVQAADWADNLSTAATATFSTNDDSSAKRIWYVGNGWQGKPFNSIKAGPTDAFAAATEGDEIWIAEGTYNIASRFDMTTKLVSFYGGFAGTESSIAERVKVENGKGWELTHPTVLKQTTNLVGGMFYAWDATSTAATNFSLDGLVMEGYDSNNSGLLWNGSSNLSSLAISIKNCWIKNFGNSGSYSDGLHLIGSASYSSFVVDSCLIENNKGNNGGGVHVQGSKTIKNSTIRNNAANSGGGIYAFQGTAADGAGLTITGCLIDGNTANANGGGIYVRDVGAKYNLHNCVVVNNSASDNGGGLYFGSIGDPAIAAFSNLTIANNRAAQGGGVAFSKAGVGAYNSIFYNNRQDDTVSNISAEAGSPAVFSNNIIDRDSYSNTIFTSCILSTDSAAIFGEGWVTALTSPGTDKGTASVGSGFTLPAVDYTGKARQVGVIDIGAYETFPAPAEFVGIPGGSVVALTWNAVSGATAYKVYADAGSLSEAATLVATASTPYYMATGLTPNTQYTFTVKAAIDPAAAATVQVATIGADAPDAPAELTASEVTETSVLLSWALPANVGSISKYIIYANRVAVDSTADATATSATIAGLELWRDYAFTLRSKSASGALSAPTNPCAVRTIDNTPPTSPAAALKSATKSTLTVEWSASADAGAVAGYIVYVDSAAIDTVLPASIDADILSLMNGKFSYTVINRDANTPYSVGVAAYDEAGNVSALVADSFSTNNEDEPLIWYVGKWVGKPADRILPAVHSAYTQIAAVTNAQLWIQGEHNLSAQINLTNKDVNGISFYGGFAGYESSPSERVRIPGGKGWEFAYPTKLKRSGDAIYSSGENPPLGDITIDGLTLEGTNAKDSEGIYWTSSPATGSVAIRNCVIQNFGDDSSAYNGGGMQLRGEAKEGSFVVEDCLIRNNKARNGGGISLNGRHHTIRNCEIRNNSVIGRESSSTPESSNVPIGGGGIYVLGAEGSASITGCLIEGNSAYSGGGLFLRSVADSAAVSNNVVVNNTAVYGGGVAFCGDTVVNTALKITNFTIASNRAEQRGGGIYIADTSQRVYNTIFWNNRTAKAEGGDTTDNVYVDASASDLTFSHNIVDRDYGYANLAQISCIAESDSAKLFGAGWVTLFPSAAEDGGTTVPAAPSTSIPSTDILGQPRVVGGAIDIGPYERQAEAGAPSVPQNLVGAPEGASNILLAWQPSTPAGDDAVAGYYIYLNGNLVDTVLAPDTTYTATGLEPGDYLIQVAAFGSTGKTSPKTPLTNVITLIEGEYYLVRITSVGEGISLTSPPTNSVNTIAAGDSLTITFTVAEAYENPVVTANGAPVSCALVGGSYVAVVKSTDDVNVSLSASPKPTVTVNADQNSIVVISPTGATHRVSANSTFEIRFNLRASYANPVVTVNGVPVEPVFGGGVYSVTITVTGDVAVNLSASLAPVTGVEAIQDNDFVVSTIYYNLLGREVRAPAVSGIYFVKETYASKKTVVHKRLIIVR